MGLLHATRLLICYVTRSLISYMIAGTATFYYRSRELLYCLSTVGLNTSVYTAAAYTFLCYYPVPVDVPKTNQPRIMGTEYSE